MRILFPAVDRLGTDAGEPAVLLRGEAETGAVRAQPLRHQSRLCRIRGCCRIRYFYGHYANRVRGERPSEELGRQKHEEQPKKRRCSPNWARLIAKVFQADPLVCKRCGGPLTIVAYITDAVAIRRILDHLGLSPPEKPPPEVRDVVRVPVDEEGREIGVSPG